jgi:hypothetical protein
MDTSEMLFIAIIAALFFLVFVRISFVVMRWEIRWDMRLLEFGFHSFLLGVLGSMIALIYVGWLIV